MDAEAVGELADALDRLLAAFAHHVGGAERPRQRDPVGMAAEEDDLLGAPAPGGDHAAQADAPSPTTATVWSMLRMEGFPRWQRVGWLLGLRR